MKEILMKMVNQIICFKDAFVEINQRFVLKEENILENKLIIKNMSEAEIFLEDETGKFPLCSEFYKAISQNLIQIYGDMICYYEYEKNCVFLNQLTNLISI
jgi:hypothetical protein